MPDKLHRTLIWVFDFQDTATEKFQSVVSGIQSAWTKFSTTASAKTAAVVDALKNLSLQSVVSLGRDIVTPIRGSLRYVADLHTAFHKLPESLRGIDTPLKPFFAEIIRAGTGLEKRLLPQIDTLISRARFLGELGLGTDKIAEDLDKLSQKYVGINDLSRLIGQFSPEQAEGFVRGFVQTLGPENLGPVLREKLAGSIRFAVAGQTTLAEALLRGLDVKVEGAFKQAAQAGGEDFQLAFEQALKRLQPQAAALGQAAGAAAAAGVQRGIGPAAVAAAAQAGGGGAGGLGGRVGKMLGTLTGIGPLGSLLSGLGQFVKAIPGVSAAFKMLSGLGSIFKGILGPIFELFRFIGGMVGPTRLLLDAFAPALSLLQFFVQQALVPLQDILVNLIAALRPFMMSILVPIQDFLTSLLDQIGPAFEGLSGVFEDIGKALAPVMQALGNIVKTILPPAIRIIKTLLPVVGTIVKLLSTILAPVLDTIAAILEPMTMWWEFLAEVLVKVAKVFELVVIPVFKFVFGLINKVIRFFTGGVSWIVRKVLGLLGIHIPGPEETTTGKAATAAEQVEVAEVGPARQVAIYSAPISPAERYGYVERAVPSPTPTTAPPDMWAPRRLTPPPPVQVVQEVSPEKIASAVAPAVSEAMGGVQEAVESVKITGPREEVTPAAPLVTNVPTTQEGEAPRELRTFSAVAIRSIHSIVQDTFGTLTRAFDRVVSLGVSLDSNVESINGQVAELRDLLSNRDEAVFRELARFASLEV